ncbi:MAG: DNA polymerase III subunit delta [Patescibacteria group bacterium]
MLIFIYGDDTYRVQEKALTMRSAFGQKHDPTGMNTVTFPDSVGTLHATSLRPGDVLQAVASAPFLAKKRMVLIRDLVGSVKKDTEPVWEQGLMKTPDSTIVVLWETMEPSALEKKALFKKLKEGADVHFYPFPQLEGYELNQWVAGRIKQIGGTIGQQALNVLVTRVGSDLWQMSNEIKKLVAYAKGEQISVDMVEKLVRASFEGQIFELVDAISRKQSARALELLDQERLSGADDFQLIGMLARQVRILLGARCLLNENQFASKQELASIMSLHPYVAQKALEQARGFTLDDLKQTHNLLFKYDTAMKTGGIGAGLAVDLIAVDLIQ